MCKGGKGERKGRREDKECGKKKKKRQRGQSDRQWAGRILDGQIFLNGLDGWVSGCTEKKSQKICMERQVDRWMDETDRWAGRHADIQYWGSGDDYIITKIINNRRRKQVNVMNKKDI